MERAPHVPKNGCQVLWHGGGDCPRNVQALSFQQNGLWQTSIVCDSNSTFLALRKDKIYGFVVPKKEDYMKHIKKTYALHTTHACQNNSDRQAPWWAQWTDSRCDQANELLWFGTDKTRWHAASSHYPVTSIEEDPHHKMSTRPHKLVQAQSNGSCSQRTNAEVSACMSCCWCTSIYLIRNQ